MVLIPLTTALAAAQQMSECSSIGRIFDVPRRSDFLAVGENGGFVRVISTNSGLLAINTGAPVHESSPVKGA
jgi:hypothetical protein